MKKNKGAWLACILSFFVFSLLSFSLLLAQQERIIYIKAKRIYTCDQSRVIENGGILIKGNKILKVEKKAKPPKYAQIIDLKDKIIIPGLIDANSHIGFHREDFNVLTEPKPWNPFIPSDFRFFAPKKESPAAKVEVRYQAVRAVFYGDKSFKKFLAQGITSAKIAIPSNNLVGGTSACVKLSAHSPSEFILKNPAGVDFSFIVEENVMKRYGDLKRIFLDAKEYRQKFEKYSKDLKEYLKKKVKKEQESKDKEEVALEEVEEPKEPKKDENKEVILKILNREIPTMIRASKINEIRAALRIRDEFRIRLILEGGQEAYKIAKDLYLKKIPVLAGPEAILIKKGERINYIKELVNNKVPVGFCSGSGIGAVFLPFQMTYAIQHGLTKIEALNILTVNAARILGVSDRIGSIAEGKDADFVVLNGAPFGSYTRVKRVYVDGRLAYSEE